MQPTHYITKFFEHIRCYQRCTLAVTMLLVLILAWPAAAQAGTSYRKRITIDHNKVMGSATFLYDFPVLIDIQNDPELKYKASGGHVENANGYDIIFTDESGAIQLDHEILHYGDSEGSFRAFVRVPQLANVSDTIIYMHYGDPSISSSQENKTGVWDSNYEAVLHLQESGNGSSDEYKDSSGNGHHGTGGGLAGSGNNTYTPNRTSGLFGYAQNFDGTNDRIRLDAVSDSTWNAVTVQAWINPDDNGDDRIFGKCYGTGSDDQTWLLRQTGYKIGTRMHTNTNNNGGFDMGGLSSGNWFMASVTWDASDNKLRVYLNGNLLNSTTLNGSTLYTNPPVSQPTIGNIPGGGRDYNGQLQEARVSKIARSATWFKTEFNNQISPSTFYSVGSEEGSTPMYSISAVANLGGTIDPNGVEIVAEGSDRSFTITAAAGYEISSLLVNGFSQGVQSSWDLVGIDQDYEIVAQFALIDDGGGDDDDDDADQPPANPLNGCGLIDIDVNYATGFKAEELTNINTHVDPVTGHIVLKTGFAAIDKENIVIPFDQEVFVNVLYIAGRNDLGYSLYEDMVDVNGDFIGFDNIPVEKRHGLFRGTWDDAYSAGDGVFDDSYAYGGFPTNKTATGEAAVAAYDDGTGRPFLVNWDDQVTPRDMRKSLGVIAGGTEIVIWDVQVSRADMHYDDPDFGGGDSLDHVFFSKREWNPDWWPNFHPDPECNPGVPSWEKVYQLDGDADEGTCHNPGGWLQLEAHGRLWDEFQLKVVNATHTFQINEGQRYDHVIVGAPVDEPNQWILGFEQNNIQHITGSDIDCNDVVFKIERKTGGRVELDQAHPITSGSADASFTGVTLEVWDYLPCPGETENHINYWLSIDNGVTWKSVTSWDKIYESNENKDILSQIENHNWSPGSPPYTYRTIHMDFSGFGLTGHQIRWRADLVSTNEACEPKILDLAVKATVMQDAEVSRAGPVVKSNVLFSGSYEIKHIGDDQELRGHLRATRIWDIAHPEDPYTPDLLWDAGEVLNGQSLASRKIFIPGITLYTFSEQIGTGLGAGTEEDDNATFFGSLTHGKILAGSVTITDGVESFTDIHTDVLEGNLGGSGNIDRFSGDYSVSFKTAPISGVPIMAHYTHYVADPELDDFNTTNVTAEKLAIDNTYIEGKGYIYDFDDNGSFDTAADSQWLINWVQGYDPDTMTRKPWVLGAIDHSMQALQTPPAKPDWFYGTAVTKAQRKSFTSFMEANAGRKTVLYNGARDGMLHAFDAGSYSHNLNDECPQSYDALGNPRDRERGCFLNYGTGEELWAFIPANLIPRLKNNVLQGDDQAFVDGSPALADIYVEAEHKWKTVLMSAQGNGGDTIFCLDVTDPDDPKFMWEFADPDLFRSRSSPSVGKIGRILVNDEPVWAAFFVSGKTYNATIFPSIYILNVVDGSVIKRVMLDDNESGRGGVPSGQPTIVDSDGNGYIDRMYIGTDKGFLYKVNIPDDPALVHYGFSNCVINTDYEFTDKDDNLKTVGVDDRYHPIYGSPVVIANNWVDVEGAITYDIKIMFGTGDSPYFDDDIDTGNTRYHFFTYSEKSPKGVCEGETFDASLDWFLELDAGHRIFSSAFAAAGKVYFGTATTETEDPCDTPAATGSQGFLYHIDIVEGPPTDTSEDAKNTIRKDVGNTVITPVVHDEQVYVKSAEAGIITFGNRKYDNEREENGFPTLEIHAWREFF